MPQAYSAEDDVNHSKWLMSAFRDARYIRINNRPLFLVYRPSDLPHPQGFAERLATTAERMGLCRPYLVAVDAHKLGFDFRKFGFDANLGFEPQLSVSPDAFDDQFRFKRFLRNLRLGVFSARLKVYCDVQQREKMKNIVRPQGTIPCCYVAWDNSARRGRNGISYINGTPDTFRVALQDRLERALLLPPNEQLVFINAWNEWAEGNYLEPNQKFGYQYLEVVRSVFS